MFKQVILPILGVMVFIVAVGIFSQKSSLLSPPTQKTITVGVKTIQVQIADTAEKRIKGLSGLASLDQDSGMLFVFDTKNVTSVFWMKDMLIPLDIIWIEGSKVIRIDKNIPAPAPNTPDDKLIKYSPGQPVDYVLEVNAGFCDSNSIKVGDSVSYSI